MTKFVLIGHVDHGKSTLAGRILCDTGYVSERDINKLQKQADENKMSSWWLSYALDTDEDERLKGKTHQFNKIDFNYNNKDYTIIDVPGHKQLVSKMIYGCSEAEIAIIVISARLGEFKQGLSGQTMEHIMITRGMGINSIIVAINKMDTIEWDETIFNNIKSKMETTLKKLRFKNIDFIPISALEGKNIDKLFTSIDNIEKIKINNNLLPVKNNIIPVQVIINNIDNIITTGYNLIIHSKDKLYTGRIIKIKDKPFIKNGNDVNLILIKLDTEEENIYSNLILRDGDKTIGYGKIYIKK